MMGDAADLGIIPMAVEEIFEHIEKVRQARSKYEHHR